MGVMLDVMVDNLRAGVDKLGARDQPFARDLLKSYDRNCGLSDKQWHWVGVLCNRIAEPQAEPPKAQVAASPLFKMLQTAKTHLKHPKLTFQFGPEKVVRLQMAGAAARVPGSINVTDGRPFGQNEWYGRIVGDQVQFSQAADAETREKLTVLLTAIAADPVKAIGEYGLVSGQCCFCNSSLTDEKSTQVGYGPVCAKHFGLPWGKK